MPQNSCDLNSLCGLPKISGSCLTMINSPIAASIPSTTEAGKIALKRASFNLARMICTMPVRQMATSKSGYPTALSPCPSRIIAASRAGASPAAGPLIVT